MHLLRTPSSEASALAPVEFSEVPEVRPDKLAYIMQGIAERRRLKHTRSFGAYVVRRGGLEAAEEAVRLMNENDPHLGNDVFGVKNDKVLHSDNGVLNQTTIHHTERGRADAIILPGAVYLDAPRRRRPQITHELFNNMVDPSALHLPDSEPAFRTTIGEDDVLIFDHAQLHAFQSRTPDRVSNATFPVASSPTERIINAVFI